jgi:hypothetical protein
MLANRRADFEAAARRREVDRWASESIVDPAAAAALRGAFPYPFYSPNVFIRIGLFAFGNICASSGLGLLMLMSAAGGGGTGMGMLAIVYGMGCLACAEVLARRSPKPFFRAGLEEAALYSGLGCLIGGVLMASGYHREPDAALAWPIAALFAVAALRYVDRILAAAALAAFVFGMLDIGRGLGAAGVSVLPPILVAISAASAWVCGHALRARALAPWDPVWKALRLLYLLLAYAAGNYWLVSQVGSALLPPVSGSGFGNGSGLPFGWAFLAFTYGVPPAYVAWGLFRKDRLFLDAGLATVAAAVLTFRYYHQTLSLEMGLIVAGGALLAVAGACLKYFRPPRHGLSAEARRIPERAHAVEAGIAAWTSSDGHASPEKAPEEPQAPEGGGGKVGGGGAQGGF